MQTDLKDMAIQRGARLQRLRRLANLSRHEVCERADFNASTLKGWEIGRHGGLTERGAKLLIDFFALHGVVSTLEWLMSDEGPTPVVNTNFKNTVESFKTSKKKLAIDREEYRVSELSFFLTTHGNSIHLKVADNKMQPHYLVDDLVAGIKREGAAIKKLNNQIVIIETAESEIMLGELQCKKNGSFQLVFANKKFKPEELNQDDIISAAPVIWHRRLDT